MLGGWIKLQSWRCSLATTAREEDWEKKYTWPQTSAVEGLWLAGEGLLR